MMAGFHRATNALIGPMTFKRPIPIKFDSPSVFGSAILDEVRNWWYSLPDGELEQAERLLRGLVDELGGERTNG